MHRLGCAETVLLFTNHRRFLPNQDDWAAHVAQLRHAAPEKAIIVEVDHPDEAMIALSAEPDILQLDKFTPEQVIATLSYAARHAPACKVSAAGELTCKRFNAMPKPAFLCWSRLRLTMRPLPIFVSF